MKKSSRCAGSAVLIVVIVMGVLSWLCLKTAIHTASCAEISYLRLRVEQQRRIMESIMLHALAWYKKAFNDIKTTKNTTVVLEYGPFDSDGRMHTASVEITTQAQNVVLSGTVFQGATVQSSIMCHTHWAPDGATYEIMSWDIA